MIKNQSLMTLTLGLSLFAVSAQASYPSNPVNPPKPADPNAAVKTIVTCTSDKPVTATLWPEQTKTNDTLTIEILGANKDCTDCVMTIGLGPKLKTRRNVTRYHHQFKRLELYGESGFVTPSGSRLFTLYPSGKAAIQNYFISKVFNSREQIPMTCKTAK